MYISATTVLPKSNVGDEGKNMLHSTHAGSPGTIEGVLTSNKTYELYGLGRCFGLRCFL